MSENDFIPLILLFLFGGFAVISALLKARGGVTALSGVVLAVLEGLSGIVLMGAALPVSGSLETATRVGILTALLVGVSSTVHLIKVRERTRAREASEGKRLYAAIKYGIGGEATGIMDTPFDPEAFAGVEGAPAGEQDIPSGRDEGPAGSVQGSADLQESSPDAEGGASTDPSPPDRGDI